MKNISEARGVSASSITRFSKDIGFNGFLELRKEISNINLESEEMKIDLEIPRYNFNKENHKNQLVEFTSRIVNSIESLNYCDSYTFENLLSISQKLNESRRILIFGTQTPASIMLNLQHQLLTFGKPCYYYPLHSDQFLLSENLTDEDFIFFVSLSGSCISRKDITLNIINSDAQSLIITQNDHIKLSREFDDIVQLGKSEDEIVGKYKLMVFVELLMQVYVNKYIY